MSDMMQGMPPGAGGMEDPQAAMQNVEDNRSILNPTDGAMMKQSGQISPGMTVGMFMKNVYGVDWESPVQDLIEAANKTMKNRTGMGKAQAMAQPGQMPGQPPGPPGRPPAVPPQPGLAGNPLEDMMQSMG